MARKEGRRKRGGGAGRGRVHKPGLAAWRLRVGVCVHGQLRRLPRSKRRIVGRPRKNAQPSACLWFLVSFIFL